MFNSCVDAFYFRLSKGKKICFPEEIITPDELVIADYAQRATQGTTPAPLNTLVEVYAPNRRRLMTSLLNALNGSFSFKTENAMLGEYDICVSEVGKEVSSVDFALALSARNKVERLRKPEPEITRQKVKEHDVDMEVMTFLDKNGEIKETLRTRTFLNRIQQELYVISTQLMDAQRNAGSLRERFVQFRAKSKSTDRWVYSMGFLWIFATGALALFQYQNFKQFLVRKKVV